ncbi:hypothetical protein OK074_1647 [Actinobacteria bacterium OK074]|nr:hypothetical protein OK074_1647 [Actinobacteria bacterium OK074]
MSGSLTGSAIRSARSCHEETRSGHGTPAALHSTQGIPSSSAHVATPAPATVVTARSRTRVE